ncbi:MAG: [Desulfovibrionaceae bacterium]|nr:[FeFe] hydrogenase H-cluster maturation GTPase HydF [Desulfovibrionaceae bacterium]
MNGEKAYRGERLHIAVLGRCNTGKSSLLNCIAGQEVAIVSPQPGTTGDPVALGFELLPLGPVTFYDTAGLDESSPLGPLRRKAGLKTLARCDLALLVTDMDGIGGEEQEIILTLQQLNTPFLLVFNKRDLWGNDPKTVKLIEQQTQWCREQGIAAATASACSEQCATELKNAIIRLAPPSPGKMPLLTDILNPGAHVIMVTPIDASAPAGRMIAPQVQCLRELVEGGRPALVVQPQELPRALSLLSEPPALVIADSQAVLEVNEILPGQIPLTTFSIIFARRKGDFNLMLDGARQIAKLTPHSKILIAEACAHHVQDDDIARVKIPRLLQKTLGFRPEISFCAGADFPDNPTDYSLVIHCGACMLNPGEMKRRLRICAAAGVAVTNFGMTISFAQGLLERVTEPLLR